MSEFKEKTIMITGATRGLGLELVKSFADSGSNLVICGRVFFRQKRMASPVD